MREQLLQKTVLRQKCECKALRDALLDATAVSLYPYQEPLSNLIIDKSLEGGPQEIPLQWARQSGKTETLIQSALPLALYNIRWLQRDFRIAFIAPSKEEQVVVVTRSRILRYARWLKPWLMTEIGVETFLDTGLRTADLIFRSSSGYEAPFRCISANPQAFVKGHTMQLMFFEQVEEMDETKMTEHIMPFGAGSETGCLSVLAGSCSPTIANDYYYRAIMERKERGPPFFVDWKLAEKYKPGYGDYVRDQMRRLGEDSDIFRTQYGNEWVLPRNKLIDRDSLLKLQWSKRELSEKNLRVAGIDIAKRADNTVVTVAERQGPLILIVAWLEFEGTDYEVQAEDIAKFLSSWKVQIAEVDITGPGDPVYDMLVRRLGDICSVREQRFSPQENDRLYKQLERELLHKRLLYPAEDSLMQRRFFEQLVDAEKVYKQNLLQVEAPKRPNAHDDYVASAALTVDAALESDEGPFLLCLR